MFSPGDSQRGAPGGASTLISYGLLNLKQRNGREVLAKISPGESFQNFSPLGAVDRVYLAEWLFWLNFSNSQENQLFFAPKYLKFGKQIAD